MRGKIVKISDLLIPIYPPGELGDRELPAEYFEREQGLVNRITKLKRRCRAKGLIFAKISCTKAEQLLEDKTVKLCDIERNTIVKVCDRYPSVPKGQQGIKRGQKLKFKRMEGLWTLCENKAKEEVRIASWTNVEKSR